MPAALDTETKRQRLEWKALLKKVAARGQRPRSKDLESETNVLLQRWGRTTDHLDSGQINQFFAKPKRASADATSPDFRVPRNPWIANAFAEALDRLGAWSTVKQEIKQNEKQELVSLLGFNVLEPPEAVRPDSRSRAVVDGEDKFHELLTKWIEKKETLGSNVMVIYSGCGFRTSDDKPLAKGLVRAVEAGMEIVFINEPDWPNEMGPKVKESLATMIRLAEGPCTDPQYNQRFWYLELKSDPPPLRFQARLVRVGALLKRSPQKLDKDLTWLHRPEVIAYWSQYLPDGFRLDPDEKNATWRIYSEETEHADIQAIERYLLQKFDHLDPKLERLIDDAPRKEGSQGMAR